jgi:DNA polymerase-3 subunit delta
MANQIQIKPIGQVFESYRIWQSKRPLYSAALNRLQANKIIQLLQLLAKIELLVKTQYDQSSWPLLHQLSAEICLPQVKL